MSSLFRDGYGRSAWAWASAFTSDLSGWDVGRVERMDDMFNGASAFASDLSGWDVGRVEDNGYTEALWKSRNPGSCIHAWITCSTAPRPSNPPGTPHGTSSAAA